MNIEENLWVLYIYICKGPKAVNELYWHGKIAQ